MTSDRLREVERALSIFKALVFVGNGAGLSDPHFDNLLAWSSNNESISHKMFRLISSTEVVSVSNYKIINVVYGERYDALPAFLRGLARSAPDPGRSVRVFISGNELGASQADLDTGGHAAVARMLAPISLNLNRGDRSLQVTIAACTGQLQGEQICRCASRCGAVQ